MCILHNKHAKDKKTTFTRYSFTKKLIYSSTVLYNFFQLIISLWFVWKNSMDRIFTLVLNQCFNCYYIINSRSKWMVYTCSFYHQCSHWPGKSRKTWIKKSDFFFSPEIQGTFILWNSHYHEIKKCCNFHLKNIATIISCSK